MRKSLPKTYTCKMCGREFTSTKSGKRAPLFCSFECYKKWRLSDDAKNRFRPKAVCLNCGKEFFADGRFKGHERKFCSKTCANQYQQKVKIYDNWITKVCPTCGKEFKVKQTSKDKIYCSKECYNKAQVKYTEGRRVGDRQKARLRRERLTKKIPNQYLEALKIVQRDRCAFCGQPLNDKGTIEHLLPVSQGGNNDWWNIVLICKSCNSKKGALSLLDYSFKECKPEIVDNTMLISYQAHKLAEKLSNKNKI